MNQGQQSLSKAHRRNPNSFQEKKCVFLVEDPPLTMLLVRYQPGTASTREVEQGQKNQTAIRSREQTAEAAGESHYSRKHKARKQAPPPA